MAWEKLPRHEADMKYLIPQRQVLADIIAASYKTVPVVVLVSDDESRQSAMEALSERDVPLPEITFVDIPFDSLWIRDYGPVCVKSPDGQAEWRHHQYEMTAKGWTDVDGSPIRRPQDAVATEKLAHLTGTPSLSVPLAAKNPLWTESPSKSDPCISSEEGGCLVLIHPVVPLTPRKN